MASHHTPIHQNSKRIHFQVGLPEGPRILGPQHNSPFKLKALVITRRNYLLSRHHFLSTKS